MSQKRKVFANTIVQVLGKAIGTVVGVFVIALMTRYLGATQFGYNTTIITYLSFVGILAEFGLHLTTVQLLSETKDESLFSDIFTFRLFLSTLIFIIAPAAIWLFPYDVMVKIGVLLATLSFWAISVNQIFIGILQIKLKMHHASIAEIVGRLILMLGVAVGVYYNLGFYTLMGVISISSLSHAVYNIWQVRKLLAFNLSFRWDKYKLLLSRAWPLGLSVFFNLLYLKADIIILSLTQSAADVGIYGVSYRVLDILTTIPAMFMGVMLPIMTTQWVDQSRDAFKASFQRAFDVLTLLAIPIIAGAWALAEPLIELLAGAEFLEAGQVLRILILAIFALFVGGGAYGYSIVAIGKQRITTLAYAATAVFSLLGYLWVIPRYSYIGAAYMTVASEFFIMIILMGLIYKFTKVIPSGIVLVKAVLAAAGMYGALYMMQDMHVLIAIILGGAVYGGLLLALKAITIEDIQEILQGNS
jgi:O-antigen/teichoic acid export membrane protein